MAVEIPEVERLPVADPVSVGRLENVAPQLAAGARENAQQFASGVDSIAESGTAAYYTYQQNAANKAVLDYGAKYHSDRETLLRGSPGVGTINDPNYKPPVVGAMQRQDDPTPVYADVNSNVQQKRAAYLKELRDQGASKIVVDSVAKRFNQIDQRFDDKTATAYEVQNASYLRKKSDANAKQAIGNVADGVAHWDVTDPNKADKVESALKELELARYHAATYSNAAIAVRDEKTGGIAYKSNSDALDETMAADKSKGLGTAAETLTASGRIDDAKDFMSIYGKQIDPIRRDKIEKTITKAVDDRMAEDAFSDVQDEPFQDGLDKLKSMDFKGSSDPEKSREKAIQKLNTRRTIMENASSQQDKDNFKAAGQLVIQRQQGGNPYLTPDQMMDDLHQRGLDSKLTVENANALKAYVKPPDTSAPEAQAKRFQLIRNANIPYDEKDPDNTGLIGRPPEQMAKDVAGLNRVDRASLFKFHDDLNKTTPSEIAKQSTDIHARLEKAFQQVGATNQDVGIRLAKQGKLKYSRDDQNKLNQYALEADQQLQQSPVLSPKERSEFVSKFVANKIANAPKEEGGFFNFLFGKDNAKAAPQSAPTNSPAPTPTEVKTSRIQYLDSFQKSHQGRPPASKQELDDFIRNGK